MSKPWFGPLPPMFYVFPITWQGWAVVAGSQAAAALIYLLAPKILVDPEKGHAWASALVFLIEVAFVVIVIWKTGRRRRQKVQ